MEWNLDPSRPIYQQIIEKVETEIASGRYQPGQQLPSVRELALEAGVNPNTMILAGSLLNAFVLLPAYAAAFGGMDAILAAGTAVNGNVTSVLGFVALCVAPFNLMKGVLVSVITFLLYKRISSLIKKAGA